MGKIRSLLAWLLILGLISGCSKGKKPPIESDKIREYANALYNRELYRQAIDEYRYYLDNYDVDKKQRANINYIIGNIYFDRLKDYENALAYYLKIKHIFPESGLLNEVNKKIVACLERLERSADAQQALEEAASLSPEQVKKARPGVVIAKIGDREITQGDLNFEINRLPLDIRSQYSDKEKKLQFLKQYIATELLYNTAKRKGLDRDKDVIEGTFQAKKALMVQKLLEEEIGKSVKIEDSDIQLYYKANRDKYAERDKKGNIKRYRPLSEVRSQVAQDLLRERQMEAYQKLIERLMKAEDVKIYEDLVE